ncbi:MAG: chorismate-binding protein [Bacteroidales bacterium]|jgi:isochorismate synthase
MSLKNTAPIIDLLLTKNLPFAIFRLPETSEFTLICQQDNEVKEVDILDIEEFSGFVVAPFKCARTGSAFLIRPDLVASNEEEIGSLQEKIAQIPGAVSQRDMGIENHVISRHAYINNMDYIIKLLQKEELHKVVLSRVISYPLKATFSHGRLFNQLANEYSAAFVYLFHLPEQGTWAGASPEALLLIDQDEASTMALAGTRLYHPETTNNPWLEKETLEQSFVSQYIANVLAETGITGYQTETPSTKRAGHLEHRLTRFTIQAKQLENKAGKMIMGLHPTPAVCGYPKGDAFHLIMRAEQHDRRFYTGFLGPLNIQGSSQLYVNLRCAEIGEDTLNLYVGGGLTAHSVSEDEWDETVEKSKTLLSVIEKL